MQIDVAVDIWVLDLLAAGRLADFHVPRRQSAPTVLDTDRHTSSQPSSDRRTPPSGRASPPSLLLFAGLSQAPDRSHRQAAGGRRVYLTGRTVDAAAARQPSTIGQTAVHAEDNASVASLMSHRLSPQDR
jgi:hypothetical protein